MIFDKTGTLTRGKLQLVRVVMLGQQDEAGCLSLAAGLEVQSEHPLAKAILLQADQRVPMEDIRAFSGKGLEGFSQGKRYWLGSYDSLTEFAFKPPAITIEPGETAVYLVEDESLLAAFILRDEIRPEAHNTIQELRKLDLTIELLSGDRPETVAHVAERLGIDKYSGGLLPDDKLNRIKELQGQGKVVAMVGDGVNDAPVLAAAQVSVAMGGGSQLAHASADMVLLSEHLERLPEAVQTAGRTLSIIRQNLGWAVGYNLIALPLAAAGWIAPWMAAIGMSASSLIVVVNALRLSSNERNRSV
jgi:Cu2+-exporting ATPase